MAKTGRVYILSNKPRGVLYLGVTSDLVKRLHQHRNRTTSGFTGRYKLRKLVWYSEEMSITEAITLEKRLKFWRRHWKVQLVEEENPEWEDLGNALL